jgi:hypothetical protein
MGSVSLAVGDVSRYAATAMRPCLSGQLYTQNPSRWRLSRWPLYPETGLSKAFQVTFEDETPFEKNILASEHASMACRTWFDRPIVATTNQILEVLERRDRSRSPCNPVTISRIIRAIFCDFWPRICRLADGDFCKPGERNARMIAERSQ